MNCSSRFRLPPTEDLPQDLVDLAESIERLPPLHREELGPLVTRVMASTGRRRRILRMVQQAMSQLRLDMKYLVFDLEATRRERDAAVRAQWDRDIDDGLESGPE